MAGAAPPYSNALPAPADPSVPEAAPAVACGAQGGQGLDGRGAGDEDCGCDPPRASLSSPYDRASSVVNAASPKRTRRAVRTTRGFP
jgi:hypothetical protein